MLNGNWYNKWDNCKICSSQWLEGRCLSVPFFNIKRLGVFIYTAPSTTHPPPSPLPPALIRSQDVMILCHHKVTPTLNLCNLDLYIWVTRELESEVPCSRSQNHEPDQSEPNLSIRGPGHTPVSTASPASKVIFFFFISIIQDGPLSRRGRELSANERRKTGHQLWSRRVHCSFCKAATAYRDFSCRTKIVDPGESCTEENRKRKNHC